MPKKRSKLRTAVEYWLFRFVIGFVGLFPLKTSIAIGRRLGLVLSNLFPRLKKTAIRNLEIAFPEMSEAERNRIAKGVFESLGRQLGVFSHLDKIKLEEIFDFVEIVGKEHFDKAYLKGKGVLFFTGHFGAWEIFCLLPSIFNYQLNILVRRIDNPLIEAYVDRVRTRFGTVTLDKKRSAKEMFNILQKGGLLGMLTDLNVQEGIFVDFFGVPAATTTAPAKLALKTGAALLPAFVVWREDKKKYVVYLEPEIKYEANDSRAEAVRDLTQKITYAIEDYARKYPEQWLWIHKRWNKRPKGFPSLY